MRFEKFVTDKTFITVLSELGAKTFVADISNQHFADFLELTGFSIADVEALSSNHLTTYVGRQN